MAEKPKSASRIYDWIKGENYPLGSKDPAPLNPPETRPMVLGGGSANRETLDVLNQGLPVEGKSAGGVVGAMSPPPPPGPTDTVPAALTPGEVVIPPDVVSFLGQKFFNDLITKAQAEMGQSGQGPQQNLFTDMANGEPVRPSGSGGPLPQGFARGGYVWPRGRC